MVLKIRMPHMEAADETRRLQFWAGDATVALVVPAVRESHPREAVGKDAAAQVAAKVALHPPGNAPAHGVGVLPLGEEGLAIEIDGTWGRQLSTRDIVAGGAALGPAPLCPPGGRTCRICRPSFSSVVPHRALPASVKTCASEG